MKKEYADLWVAELRSGRHEQGNYLLHRKDGRKCCLGVACYLERDNLKITRIPNHGDIEYNGFSSKLPPFMLDKWGIQSGNGKLLFEHNGKVYKSLTHANDLGVTFEEIADIIEKNYEQL